MPRCQPFSVCSSTCSCWFSSVICWRSPEILRTACNTVVWSRPPNSSPISGQALLRQFLGQIHGNLPRPGNAGGPLLGVHVGDLDLVVVGHRFLDVFHTDLPVLDAQQVAQRFARQRDGNLFLVETRVRQDLAQRTFQLSTLERTFLATKNATSPASRPARNAPC